MINKTTEGFRGEYSFLSNFTRFETPMLYGGDTYITNEHFYQAMKFKERAYRTDISNRPSKGLKETVNKNKLLWREDWDDIKVDVMRYGLAYKFSDNNPLLLQKLLNTKGVELVEYNWWNDKFWGVCSKTGVGDNMLGRLLMEIRDSYE